MVPRFPAWSTVAMVMSFRPEEERETGEPEVHAGGDTDAAALVRSHHLNDGDVVCCDAATGNCGTHSQRSVRGDGSAMVTMGAVTSFAGGWMVHLNICVPEETLFEAATVTV